MNGSLHPTRHLRGLLKGRKFLHATVFYQNTEYRIYFFYKDTMYLETGPSAEAIKRIPIQGMPIADEMCERGSAHYDAWSPR